MRLVFLGTGGSLPTPERNVSATALQRGAEILLFDCGEGTQRQFMASSASFMKVQKVFITHFHGDHFLGLPGMIQSMSFSGRTAPLSVFGPPGMVDIVRIAVTMGHFGCGFDIQVRELRGGQAAEFDGYEVHAVGMDHIVPALGYILKEKDRPGRFRPDRAKELGVREGPFFRKLQSGEAVRVGGAVVEPGMVMGPPRPGMKIAFSGDTRPCDAFIEAARGADVIVHEATIDTSLRVQAAEFGHSTAREAAEVAAKAGAGALYLNHISNRYEDASVLEAEAREVFPKAVLAHDLMVVQIRHRER